MRRILIALILDVWLCGFSNSQGSTCAPIRGCDLSLCSKIWDRETQGPPGKMGTKGDKGEKGTNGLNGIPGPPGPDGPAGRQGQKGAIGPMGPPGAVSARRPSQPGTKGAKGAVGPRGAKGVKGERGLTGPKGAVGKPGEGVDSTVQALIDEATRKFEEMEKRIDEKIAKFEKKYGGPTAAKPSPSKRPAGAVVGSGPAPAPSSCQALFSTNPRATNGIYNIYRSSARKNYEVFCDFTTDGGGWTVFQRRMDGSQNFNRSWADYQAGFGDKKGEFWLGLETLHQLTRKGDFELRIDLKNWERETAFAKYETFSVGSRTEGYKLTVGQYSGHQGDSLTYHNGQMFSTYDRDLDSYTFANCARIHWGGWWFNSCMGSNLNGLYYVGGKYKSKDYDGIGWYHWSKDAYYSLKFTEMKFREKT